MDYRITVYRADDQRRILPMQTFNAETIEQAIEKARAACGLRHVFKVEVSVVLTQRHKLQGDWMPFS